MSSRPYQECTQCVMDTTDPEIVFDDSGICNHCHVYVNETSKRWFPDAEGEKILGATIKRIQQEGRDQEYDCIIGLSGGIDSTYLAVKLKGYGLRPLAVHVDGGWNSETAVYNIEQVVKHCNYDLHTHVIDWEEMRDLQVAYLRSHVANQDVPQDHAFFASLYHFAVENNIKYVISGGNIATEAVFPRSWHHSAMDAINLHAIHKKFGSIPLKHYRTINFLQYYIYYPFIYGMKTFRPLNFMAYDKAKALEFLQDTIQYKDYGKKHGESIFTKFFQNHYLPTKYGYDKRRPHLSSMILSGQITRQEALEQLDLPLYDKRELIEDTAFIARKLNLSIEELNSLTTAPGVSYKAYRNWDAMHLALKRLQKAVEKVRGRRIGNYN